MEQAAKVGSTDEPPKESPPPTAPITTANSKVLGFRFAIAFGLTALCTGILVLVLVLRPPPDPIVITNSPTVSPTPQSEFDYLVDLLEAISGDKLFLEGSAQYQAFDWLLNEDTTMLDISSATSASTLINRYVLATLYFSTNGPSWIEDYNFLSDLHVCDWNSSPSQRVGVECYRGSDEPASLRFDSVGLDGTIPAEISALTALVELSIVHDEGLYGSIPSEIGLLTKLSFLQLASTGLAGTIPRDVSKLMALETLSLPNNYFTGTIPEILRLGSSLETVVLQFNDFEGTLPVFEPRYQYGFDDDGIGLPLVQRQQNNIRWLVLTGNSRVTGTIPPTFYLQPDLVRVSFSGTSMEGTISSQISSLSNLEYFDIEGANFSGSIPLSIGNLDRLVELKLGDNALIGTLPTQLGRLNRLRQLQVQGNLLRGTIPTELGELTDMQVFYVNGNRQLSGPIPSSFAEELTDLTELSIQGTRISSGLDETYCLLFPDPSMMNTTISADCGGVDPKIPCDCCHICCVDGQACGLDR